MSNAEIYIQPDLGLVIPEQQTSASDGLPQQYPEGSFSAVPQTVEDLDKLPEGLSAYEQQLATSGLARRLEYRNAQTSEENGALQEQRAKLIYENTHDRLTGLLNKEALHDEVAARIEAGKPFGFAFLDLDAFKLVNDKLSHARGDEVLAAFGEFIPTRFRRESDAGRLGGDEFGLLFGLGENHRRTLDLHEAMDKEYDYIKKSFDEFVATQAEDVRALGFNVSVGVALYDPSNPVDAPTLINQADEAMYEEKHHNGGAR